MNKEDYLALRKASMIDRLVEDDIVTIKEGMQNNDIEYLDYILRSGVAYNKMTDEELLAEFENRSWEIEE
jgi:hypothetical protein